MPAQPAPALRYLHRFTVELKQYRKVTKKLRRRLEELDAQPRHVQVSAEQQADVSRVLALVAGKKVLQEQPVSVVEQIWEAVRPGLRRVDSTHAIELLRAAENELQGYLVTLGSQAIELSATPALRDVASAVDELIPATTTRAKPAVAKLPAARTPAARTSTARSASVRAR